MTEHVRADLVATVWKIIVDVGDAVGDDDAIVILESMKMEIPVFATTGGLVRSIDVAEGDTVQEGDLIATIDAAS